MFLTVLWENTFKYLSCAEGTMTKVTKVSCTMALGRHVSKVMVGNVNFFLLHGHG